MDDEDIVVAVLADGSVLDKDDIPNDNQSVDCFSCGAKMTGVYCIDCGQKNDDYRRSISRLVGELIGSFTALESRIWRTWGALLFKPGKVAREFADGARMKWSTPIRVFLAVSIILFGFLSFSQTQLISIDLNVLPKKGITKPHAELTNKDLRISGAVRFFEKQKQIDVRNKTRNFDLIDKWMSDNGGLFLDIDEDTGVVSFGGDEGGNDEKLSNLSDEEQKRRKQRQAILDELRQDAFANLTPEQIQALVTAKESTDAAIAFASQEQIKNLFIRVVRDPALVNSMIYKWLPRIMFLMMPITMFIGVLFIRGRKNALLYDHLVHAAYIHAVAFFLVFLGILLMQFLPGSLVAKFLFVVLLIYLPLSLKRMFGRGWFKTIWASYGVGLLYVFTITLVMTGAISYQIYKLAVQYG